MERHILGQGNGQVKAESQVAVTLLEAVDLLLRLTAAFGQQDFGRFNDGGVQGGEAVEGIGLAEGLQDALELPLLPREQLHEAREGAGRCLCHVVISYLKFK